MTEEFERLFACEHREAESGDPAGRVINVSLARALTEGCMRNFHRTLTAAAAGLLFVGIIASAQEPTSGHRRDGPWIGFGFGASNNDLECTGCTSTGPDDPWRGPNGSGGFLAVAGALSQQLLIGGEVNISGAASGKRGVTIFQLLLTAQYFPVASRGVHVTAAVGPASFQIGGAGGGVEGYGTALRVGAGYDIAIGGRFALTPYATVARTFSGGSVTSSGNAGPVTRLENRSLTQYGVAIHSNLLKQFYGGR